MSGKPAATIGSMHTCPMCSGATPHVGGPITGSGQPNILHNNKPAATIGDICTCAVGTDTIVQGFANILHNGKPAVAVGHMTSHGGVVSSGESNIVHSSTGAIVTLPNIPVPNHTVVNTILGNTKEAKANQAKLQEPVEGEPLIYNLKWIKDETIIRNSKQIRQITLAADVLHIADGETITFTFEVPEIFERSEETVTLSGTVSDKKVETIWEIEDLEDQTNES